MSTDKKGMRRNLMSMDTEEMMLAQPMDAVILIGGCDKTVLKLPEDAPLPWLPRA